jgi:hypothetical protein
MPSLSEPTERAARQFAVFRVDRDELDACPADTALMRSSPFAARDPACVNDFESAGFRDGQLTIAHETKRVQDEDVPRRREAGPRLQRGSSPCRALRTRLRVRTPAHV